MFDFLDGDVEVRHFWSVFDVIAIVESVNFCAEFANDLQAFLLLFMRVRVLFNLTFFKLDVE